MKPNGTTVKMKHTQGGLRLAFCTRIINFQYGVPLLKMVYESITLTFIEE